MNIAHLYTKDRPLISFELFPPRTKQGLEKLPQQVVQLAALQPDFISVTCHNHTNLPQYTHTVCEQIAACRIPAVAHVTAQGNTQHDLSETLQLLDTINVPNVFALRGDILEENNTFDLTSSTDVMRHIKETYHHFSIGGTCYPHPHPDSQGAQKDIAFLQEKVHAGSDYLISQMFFNNHTFYEFREQLQQSNITVPISAGIMPVVNKRQVERICQLSGVTPDTKHLRILDKYQDDPQKLFEAGVIYATEQIIDLITEGVDGIHLYTLNNIELTKKIMENITPFLSK